MSKFPAAGSGLGLWLPLGATIRDLMGLDAWVALALVMPAAAATGRSGLQATTPVSRQSEDRQNGCARGRVRATAGSRSLGVAADVTAAAARAERQQAAFEVPQRARTA